MTTDCALTRSLSLRVPASRAGDVAAPPVDMVSAVDPLCPILSGVSPLRGAGLLRLRVEPLSKAQRLAPSGGHPSRGLAVTLRARWRAGRRRTAALRAWPVRSPMQRSRLRLHRDAEQPGQAGCAGGMTTAVRSRARGSRAFFPSRVRERGPLDELTRCSRAARHFAALRSAPQAAPVPDRNPGHPPCPMPGR